MEQKMMNRGLAWSRGGTGTSEAEVNGVTIGTADKKVQATPRNWSRVQYRQCTGYRAVHFK